jgi:hypothetical protein
MSSWWVTSLVEASRVRIRTLLLVATVVWAGKFSTGQEANPLGKIKRIYVDSFGSTGGMNDFKKVMSARLRKSHEWEVVDTPDKADATLEGRGEIWIRGYYSLNPRAGTSPANGQPVYGGYVSVELKDTRGETLWSYLATLHSDSTNACRDLSGQVVKHLNADSSKAGK